MHRIMLFVSALIIVSGLFPALQAQASRYAFGEREIFLAVAQTRRVVGISKSYLKDNNAGQSHFEEWDIALRNAVDSLNEALQNYYYVVNDNLTNAGSIDEEEAIIKSYTEVLLRITDLLAPLEGEKLLNIEFEDRVSESPIFLLILTLIE
ncbi:MAG: hypothetical protein ABIF87_17890 [Pseudomonadota bacterium]